MVGEVSTVRESVAVFAGHILSRQIKPGDLLCLHLQAEKLLAAERAEKEKIEAAWLEAEGIISDLKAELATCLAKLRGKMSNSGQSLPTLLSIWTAFLPTSIKGTPTASEFGQARLTITSIGA
ncbi:hypothetical protein HED54_05725 [Ochrobactrum anthropi ATCC 49188]|nr:hypothetical protein [Brucella anthropi ATCC 49188]